MLVRRTANLQEPVLALGRTRHRPVGEKGAEAPSGTVLLVLAKSNETHLQDATLVVVWPSVLESFTVADWGEHVLQIK